MSLVRHLIIIVNSGSALHIHDNDMITVIYPGLGHIYQVIVECRDPGIRTATGRIFQIDYFGQKNKDRFPRYVFIGVNSIQNAGNI